MFFHALYELTGRLFAGRAYEDGMPGILYSLYWTMYWVSVFAELWEAEGRPAEADRQVRRWGRLLHWPGTAVYLVLRLMQRRRRRRARRRIGQGTRQIGGPEEPQ
jgi:hypothetical protein